MKVLLALISFVLFHVGAWSSKPQNNLGEDFTPEEPLPIFVGDPDAKDSDFSSLSTKQKAILNHPKIQHMLRDMLMKDLKAYGEDHEIEDNLHWMEEGLPLGLVHPRALAQWGIDWKDLGNDESDHEDEDKAYQQMGGLIQKTLDKYNDKHQVSSPSGSKTKTEASGHSMWHPLAALRNTVQQNGEDVGDLVEESKYQ